MWSRRFLAESESSADPEKRFGNNHEKERRSEGVTQGLITRREGWLTPGSTVWVKLSRLFPACPVSHTDGIQLYFFLKKKKASSIVTRRNDSRGDSRCVIAAVTSTHVLLWRLKRWWGTGSQDFIWKWFSFTLFFFKCYLNLFETETWLFDLSDVQIDQWLLESM